MIILPLQKFALFDHVPPFFVPSLRQLLDTFLGGRSANRIVDSFEGHTLILTTRCSEKYNDLDSQQPQRKPLFF
jgi:hypothetical protein